MVATRRAFAFLAFLLCLASEALAVPPKRDDPPETALHPGTARSILRLVEGRPDIEDEDIMVTLQLEGTTILWQCLWLRDGGNEVTVLQIRDSDGAYRKPDITQINSLKFGMRVDLRETITKLVTEAAMAGPEDGEGAPEAEEAERPADP